MQVGFVGTTVTAEPLFEHMDKEREILWPTIGDE
jgi:hypothetical protein